MTRSGTTGARSQWRTVGGHDGFQIGPLSSLLSAIAIGGGVRDACHLFCFIDRGFLDITPIHYLVAQRPWMRRRRNVDNNDDEVDVLAREGLSNGRKKTKRTANSGGGPGWLARREKLEAPRTCDARRGRSIFARSSVLVSGNEIDGLCHRRREEEVE